MRVRGLSITLLTALSLLATAVGVSAQEITWADQFGTEDFDAIYALDVVGGDVYGVGELGGAPGGCDVITRAYHGDGREKWTRLIDTSGCDFAEGITAAGSSVYIGGGTSGALPDETNGGSFDAFVRKYSEDGAALWTDQFGAAGSDFVRAAVASEDAVFAVGSVRSALSGQQHGGSADAFVRKYDASGNEVWTRQFGTPGIDSGRDIDLLPDGGVVVVGETGGSLPGHDSFGGTDVFVRRYNAQGKERWTQQFGSAGSEIAFGVDAEQGAIYVAGDIAGALGEQPYAGGPRDAFVRKYNGDGNEVWTRTIGTAGFDRAIRIAADGNRVVVVGRVGGALPGQEFAGGVTDPFVRSYDAEGIERWTIQFGSEEGSEAATGVAIEEPGGDIFVSGAVGGALAGNTNEGFIDAFVMKINV